MVKYVNQLKSEKIDTKNYEKILKTKENNRQNKALFIDGLYPDYRAGVITFEEYSKYKTQAQEELAQIEKEIESLKTQIEEIKQGTCEENEFIKHFLKYQNIDKLTRQMVVDLIDNIWVYDNHHIEIDIKYKDEYKMALDFINENKQYLIQPELKQVANG